MKPLLLILLLPLAAFGQTTYNVLSTTPNRTIVGGVTNLPHLNSNNVFTGTMNVTSAVTLTNASNVFAGDGSGLTGISGGGGTNAPLLSGTNVWTGTNTFTAANLYPANGIFSRLLWSSATNISLPTITTNGGAAIGNYSAITNNGCFSNLVSVIDITLPALIGSNSMVAIIFSNERASAQAGNTVAAYYAGTNTNFFGLNSAFGASLITTTPNFGTVLFYNNRSMTNQVIAREKFASFAHVPPLVPGQVGATNLLDTSAPWRLMVGFCVTNAISITNTVMPFVAVIEYVIP